MTDYLLFYQLDEDKKTQLFRWCFHIKKAYSKSGNVDFFSAFYSIVKTLIFVYGDYMYVISISICV